MENLEELAPEEPLYAVVFMILLYAFKSLTVFFPIAVLNILGGFLFMPGYALIVNSIGVLVELTISYWAGRISGAGLVERMCAKYPKLGEVLGERESDSLFLTFLLHMVCFLPGDAVSMCFGARKMPFFKFLIGSFLGVLPGMAATTLLGSNITDPTSPAFWIFVGLIAGISALSVLIYFLWKMKHRA
ncbi:MAG: VTT domain-containing protein [Lachnospiraceae bacterium]|nr:VTT domain-containing protein [Lachnospiraceae bacterium]